MSATTLSRPFVEPYELPVSGSLSLARIGSLVTGVAGCVSAILGLTYGEQWLYQSDELTLGQVYGHDLIVLVLVLPVLALSVRSAARGSARALITWAGCLVYLAYWYHFMLGGIDFGAVYLLHLALVGSSLFSLAILAARLDAERFAHRMERRVPARLLGGFIAVMGSVFATAGVLDIVQRLWHNEVLGGAARGIYAVDLTIMLPMTIAAGALLWRRQTWGYVLGGPLLVNATFSAATLFAASVSVRGAFADTGLTIAGLGAATLVLVAATVRFVRGVQV